MSKHCENLKRLQAMSQEYAGWCNKNRAVKISEKLTLSFHASANCVYAKIFSTEKKKFTYFLSELYLLCEMRNQIFHKFIENPKNDCYKLRFSQNIDLSRGQQDQLALHRVSPQTQDILRDSVLVMSTQEYNQLQAFLKYASPTVKELLMQRKRVDPVQNESWYSKTGPVVQLQWTSGLSTMWDGMEPEVISYVSF